MNMKAEMYPSFKKFRNLSASREEKSHMGQEVGHYGEAVCKVTTIMNFADTERKT